MSSAAWVFLGTLAGGALTFFGNWTVNRQRLTAESRIRRDAETAAQREERKAAFLRLLVICRQLRTLSRAGRTRDLAEIDRLRTELSSVTYEIDLVAPPAVAEAAHKLARAVRAYLSEARALDDRTGAGEPGESALDEHRRRVRGLVDEFIDAARRDLSS